MPEVIWGYRAGLDLKFLDSGPQFPSLPHYCFLQTPSPQGTKQVVLRKKAVVGTISAPWHSFLRAEPQHLLTAFVRRQRIRPSEGVGRTGRKAPEH